jgi:hypothetical protein
MAKTNHIHAEKYCIKLKADGRYCVAKTICKCNVFSILVPPCLIMKRMFSSINQLLFLSHCRAPDFLAMEDSGRTSSRE